MVRFYAAEALGNIRDPGSVQPLMGAALHDSVENVREAAAKALARVGQPEAFPALEKALQSDQAEVRKRAVAAIAEFDDSLSGPVLASLVMGDDNDLRNQSGGALYRKKFPLAVEKLAESFITEGPIKRQRIVEGLSFVRFIYPLAMDVLVSALKDPERNIQLIAAKAFAEKPAVEAFDALLDRFKYAGRRGSIQYIARIGPLEGPPLDGCVFGGATGFKRKRPNLRSFGLGRFA